MADHEIDRLNLRVGITNTTATVRNIDKLTDSLTKLETVLGKVSSHNLSGIGVGTTGGGKGSGKRGGIKPTSASSKLFNLTKLASTVYLSKRLGRVVAGIAQAGSDYTETLNLWETAMGNNLNVATKFVDKMNEAYGVSEKTLMNAQATFKNMLGSLGQISDEVAYKLSEGVTQMALDYASLYNQTFEQAMYKFQAALAGQVRPIRSVSGFDITETTLFQLYRSLGGEKTMRQLTRTEKQLLSIYAIFQQMERSGTIGDLDKTMESYANQTRVASEKMQEILQYSGILLTHTIQESGLLQQLNGYLIFFSDVLKAVADEYGAIQHFGDPFQVTTDGALAAYDATEKLNNKLLGFDKFRALNSANDSDIGIDERLLEALSSYDSILNNAGMEAQEIAKALKEASGLFNDDGALNVENWENLTSAIKEFGRVTLAVSISTAIPKLVSSLQNLGKSFGGLNNILMTGAIYAILKAIEYFKEGDTASGIFATGLGVLAGAFLLLKNATELSILSGKGFIKFFATNVLPHFSILGAGIMVLVVGLMQFISAWDEMDSVGKWVGLLVSLAAAITSVAVALHFASGNWVMALGIGAAVAGAGLMVTTQLAKVEKFADGGLPNKGSLFIAGEAGAELVTNMGGGQSGVMNMEQLENAVARGMYVGLSSVDLHDDRPINVNIDGQRFFTASRDIYRRNGYDVSRV